MRVPFHIQLCASCADLDMSGERVRAMQEVNDLIASGTIRTFAEWQQVVRHPENPGNQTVRG